MVYLSKIYRISLYVLVFILPIQTRLILKPGALPNGYFEYGTFSLYLSDILFGLILFLSALALIYKAGRSAVFSVPQRYVMLLKTLGILSLIFIILAGLSIGFSSDRWLGFYKLGWLLAGLFLFWIIALARYDELKLLIAFGLGLTIQAGIGLWQFITQSSFSSKWLGIALHEARELGTSVVEIYPPGQLPERWLRAYGGLDHPNILGGILALGALFILGWLINASRLKQKGGVAVKRPIEGVLLGFYLILISGLFVSFSKSAWLGFGLGFLSFFILVLFSKSLIRLRETLKILLISGILFFLLFSLYGDLARERFRGSGRLEARSASERIALSREALGVIKSRPLTGTGIGNYVRHLYGQKSGADMPASLRMFSAEWQPVHSMFLLIPAEIGLAGLVILISIIGLSFFLAAKGGRILAIPAILCLLVLMAFDHWLWSLHFGVFSFWLSLGLAVRPGLGEPKA